MPRAGNVVANFAAKGRYHFTTPAMQSALGVSPAATRLALSRLAKKGLIASPARGFYVIVPPEYKHLGCLPASQFIPALMEHLQRPYYAALLSAAEYHGSGHHRPQVFQVAVADFRRPISCGKVRVRFFVRKHVAKVPVDRMNTPRGTILVSSIEATAFDLVGYERSIGGMDLVATCLAEFAENCDPALLAAAAQTAPRTWAQRLGYLLELVGAGDKAVLLKEHVRRCARDSAPLQPGGSERPSPRAKEWRLRVNADIEVEA